MVGVVVGHAHVHDTIPPFIRFEQNVHRSTSSSRQKYQFSIFSSLVTNMLCILWTNWKTGAEHHGNTGNSLHLGSRKEHEIPFRITANSHSMG